MSNTFLRTVGGWLGLAAVYWLTARLGLLLAISEGNVTPVWPPSGIALAALLLLGRRFWPGVMLGAFAATFTTGVALPVALGIAAGNTLEALLGFYLLRRHTRLVHPPWRVSDVLGLVLAALLAPLASAGLGTLSLWLGDVVPAAALGAVWSTWWLGDVMGVLLLTPALVLWIRRPRRRRESVWWLEGLALLLVFTLVTQAVYGDWPFAIGSHYPLAFVYLPLLVWVAFRFGVHGAVSMNLLLAAVVVGGTLQHSGPFIRASVNESLLLAQSFLGLVSVTALVLAAVVGEQRRTGRALRESEMRLRTVLETAVDAIITIDRTGTVCAYNPAAERLFGWPADRVLGRNVDMLMPEPDRRQHDDYLERYLRTGQARIIGNGREVEGLRRDGSLVPLDLAVGEMRLGEALFFTGIIRDISGRRQAELQLRESEMRFRQLVEHLESVFWIFDLADQRLIYVSPAYSRIWGRSVQGAYNDPDDWLQLVHPQDRDWVAGNWHSGRISGSFDQQFRLLLPNQDLRWVHVRGFPIPDAQGKPYRIAGIVEDITRHRQLERELHTRLYQQRTIAELGRRALTARSLDRLLDEAPALLAVTLEADFVELSEQRSDGSLLLRAGSGWKQGWVGRVLDDGSKRMTMTLAADIPVALPLPKPSGDTLPPLLRDHGVSSGVAVAVRGRRRPFGVLGIYHRARRHHSNDERHFLQTAANLLALAIEQHQTADEMRQRQTELAHMARLTLAGELASGMAHELRQPLSAIDGYGGAGKLLLQADEPDIRQLDYVMDKMLEQARRASLIIKRTKDFTRRAAPQRDAADINALVEAVVRFTEHALRRHRVQWRLELDPTLPMVLVDNLQVQQVLVNLINNAMEAMVEADTPHRELYLTTAHGEREVRVQVRDNGPGLDPQAQAQLFQPFVTTKAQGTGLGLSISKTIVEAHGGRLWVTPDPGGGLCFSFTLPLAESPPDPADRSSR